MDKDYDRLKKVAMSVDAGIILIGHEVNSVFPFSKSITLDKIEEIRDESEYTVRDISYKKNQSASKELSASLIIAYISDLEQFYTLMKKDSKTLTQVTIALFCMVLILTGIIIVN